MEESFQDQSSQKEKDIFSSPIQTLFKQLDYPFISEKESKQRTYAYLALSAAIRRFEYDQAINAKQSDNQILTRSMDWFQSVNGYFLPYPKMNPTTFDQICSTGEYNPSMDQLSESFSGQRYNPYYHYAQVSQSESESEDVIQSKSEEHGMGHLNEDKVILTQKAKRKRETCSDDDVDKSKNYRKRRRLDSSETSEQDENQKDFPFNETKSSPNPTKTPEISTISRDLSMLQIDFAHMQIQENNQLLPDQFLQEFDKDEKKNLQQRLHNRKRHKKNKEARKSKKLQKLDKIQALRVDEQESLIELTSLLTHY